MAFRTLSIAAFIAFGSLANALTVQEAFNDVAPGKAVCFGKAYSAQHLKKNKKQTVERIRVTLAREGIEDGGTYLRIDARLKNKGNTNWHNSFVCQNNEAGKAVCFIECDGGSVELQKRANGRLLMKSNGFVLYGGCGEDVEQGKEIWLKSEAGGDDIFDLPLLADQTKCVDFIKERDQQQ